MAKRSIAEGWGINPSASDEKEKKERLEHERSKRIERSRRDPQFFCRYYLRHYFSHPITGEFTGLASWQQGCIDLVREHDLSAMAAPRGHGKTTFLSFALTLRDILLGITKFTVYIGPTKTAASDRINEILMELQNNERIIEDFGDLTVDGRHQVKLRSDDLQLTNGARIVARGAGQGLRGVKSRQHRPDRIILDDVDKDDEAASADRVEKRIKWFKRVVLGLQGSGRVTVLVVGNIIARKTLLTDCLGNKHFASRVYKSILDDGTVLMPNLWTIAKLEKIREEIGSTAFSTEYQNSPPSEDTALFREEWLEARWDRSMLEQAEPWVVIALDLSKGKSERSDFQGLVGIRRDEDGRIYILKADLSRRTRRELAQRCFTFAMAVGLHRLVAFVVEANGFQEWFAEELSEVGARLGVDLPIVQVTHTIAKYERVSRLSPIAEGGRLLFPTEDEEDDHTRLLRRQLSEFPDGAHDDGPDVLEMAVAESARRVRGSHFRVLPFTPFERQAISDDAMRIVKEQR